MEEWSGRESCEDYRSSIQMTSNIFRKLYTKAVLQSLIDRRAAQTANLLSKSLRTALKLSFCSLEAAFL